MGSYSARQLGRETTAQVGGPFNWVVSDQRYEQATIDDLMHEMGQGLLITDLMGHGVSHLTGDFSQGAFGFWVEDGRVAYPVHEITLASNLKTMFQEVQGISGADRDIRGNYQSGAWWLKNISVASQ